MNHHQLSQIYMYSKYRISCSFLRPKFKFGEFGEFYSPFPPAAFLKTLPGCSSARYQEVEEGGEECFCEGKEEKGIVLKAARGMRDGKGFDKKTSSFPQHCLQKNNLKKLKVMSGFVKKIFLQLFGESCPTNTRPRMKGGPPTTFSSSSSSNSRATKSISPPSWRTKKYENFRQNLHGLGERGRISLEGEDDDKGIFFTCTFAIVHQSTILLIFLLVSRMWEMHVRA